MGSTLRAKELQVEGTSSTLLHALIERTHAAHHGLLEDIAGVVLAAVDDHGDGCRSVLPLLQGLIRRNPKSNKVNSQANVQNDSVVLMRWNKQFAIASIQHVSLRLNCRDRFWTNAVRDGVGDGQSTIP